MEYVSPSMRELIKDAGPSWHTSCRQKTLRHRASSSRSPRPGNRARPKNDADFDRNWRRSAALSSRPPLSQTPSAAGGSKNPVTGSLKPPAGFSFGRLAISLRRRYLCGMRSKKAASSDLRSWRVLIQRDRAQYLGVVEAPTESDSGTARTSRSKPGWTPRSRRPAPVRDAGPQGAAGRPSIEPDKREGRGGRRHATRLDRAG